MRRYFKIVLKTKIKIKIKPQLKIVHSPDRAGPSITDDEEEPASPKLDDDDVEYVPEKSLDKTKTTTKKTRGKAKNKAEKADKKAPKKVYGQHLLFGDTDKFFRNIASCPPACAKIVEKLQAKCGGQPQKLIPEMIYDAVHEWIIERNIKLSSALTALSVLFTHLQKVCLIPEEIANSNLKSKIKTAIRKYTQTSEENPVLEEKFLRAFINENSIMAATVGILLITGMRSSELHSIIWEDKLSVASVNRKALIFVKAKLKDDKGSKLAHRPGNKFLIVPIRYGDYDLLTLNWLIKILTHDPPVNSKITNYLKQSYYKLKLKIPSKLGAHATRRTTVNLLMEFGTTSESISKFIQWSGSESITFYKKENCHYNEENLEKIKKPMLLSLQLKNALNNTRTYESKSAIGEGKIAILRRRLKSKGVSD